MDQVPLRNLTGRGLESYTTIQGHQNIHESFNTLHDDISVLSEPGIDLTTPSVNADPFIPISDEEAFRVGHLPEPNFRPPPLKAWCLISLVVWNLVCLGGVAALVYLGETQPPWFRFRSQSTQWVWLYSPTLVGFVTVLTWRSVAQWYNRIIPYVRMASVPVSCAWEGRTGPPKNLMNIPLNQVPSGDLGPFHIYLLVASGDWLSAAVNCTVICTWFLIPLKSSLFQLEKDDQGWRIRVSKAFGVLGISIYLWLLTTTLWIYIHLRKRKTGLKWNPIPLSSQICLLQGSNIFDSFDDINLSHLLPLRRAVMAWPKRGQILRLGYWKREGTDIITHGVRFLPRHGQGQPQAEQAHQLGGENWEDNLRPDVDRVWNVYLVDWYLVFTTALGMAALIAASIAWARGQIFHPFSTVFTGSSLFLLFRFVIYSLLPTLLFSLFSITFVNADLYNRTMMPIQKMASPLPADDCERIFGSTQHAINGAAAADSMLLDYLSPSVLSCIAQAFERGDYKIILGVALATLHNLAYVFVAQIFYFDETGDSRSSVEVHDTNLYMSFAILIIYCLSNWLLRPRGPVRTCRPPWTLADFASLVYRSHIMSCPEFWLQNACGREEHLHAQVVLADRIYRFGIYKGTDELEHVGISFTGVPQAWVSGHHDVACLASSAGMARMALQFGLYDRQSQEIAHDFVENGPPTWPSLLRVRTNQYRSWRQAVKDKASFVY
ncbi:hypothetical protein F66182_5074 [Fusarium sp. NRRL 66182]|nr:hypothetical protein F66182_5074 [Fusarium sp. NRRL 66182]